MATFQSQINILAKAMVKLHEKVGDGNDYQLTATYDVTETTLVGKNSTGEDLTFTFPLYGSKTYTGIYIDETAKKYRITNTGDIITENITKPDSNDYDTSNSTQFASPNEQPIIFVHNINGDESSPAETEVDN